VKTLDTPTLIPGVCMYYMYVCIYICPAYIQRERGRERERESYRVEMRASENE
jgi:hypothetical protein